MGRGGKFNGKGHIRKRARSEEAGSDDSDEDYVVSDDNDSSSLDGFPSDGSFDSLVEEEEDEDFPRARNFNRSKARNGVCGRRKSASLTSRKRGRVTYSEDDGKEGKGEEDEDEDEDGEFQGMKNFNTSKAKSGCVRQKNARQTSTKRERITYAERLEDDEEEDEEENDNDEEEEEKDENYKVEDDGEDVDEKDGNYKAEEDEVEKDENFEVEEEEDGKDEEEEDEAKDENYKVEEEEEKVESEGDEEDLEADWVEEVEGDLDEEDEEFDCDDDDDEFTPEEVDFSDEEEEMKMTKKNKNGTKISKKVSHKRASTRGHKRRNSRTKKKPSRNRRRKNVGLKSKVISVEKDDFIDNGPAIRTTSRRTRGQKRRRVLLSDSDRVSSGSSDFRYTISEEEREQVREAEELYGSSRINLRSSSTLLIKNEEDEGVHEDLCQPRKPPGRKGKEKIEEPQGRKGKEKLEVLKSEVVKQMCGICLSEEDKRRVRGVLNCCTHYFCFACIMEWAKVESRCPLCKQRFATISKPARSTTAIDLREVVIQVPERDQVYQPSEEELRSYIDPYEYVFCSECHQGGDDGLMLLCDICDSPAHTYCVGLGHEVPEGNWYCNGCRPVAMGSSSSPTEETVAEQRLTIQSLPVRPPPIHVRESIDLNLISSPRPAFSQGLGHTSRFTGRSVEGASPVSGGGVPTLSGRRWLQRQIQHLRDRMTSTAGRTSPIPATISSASNLYSSQIDQNREMAATEHAMVQDAGTSYHTFFQERLCSNSSPLMQNGALWPGLVETPPVLDCGQVHQFRRSSNIVVDGNFPPEEINLHIAKEQLQSMVKTHLKSLSQNIDLGHNTFNEIARSCMHTILAACGLEHNKSEVSTVPLPSFCPHMERVAAGQTSLIRGCCSSCFDSFVGDVVKRILDTRVPSLWLKLGL